MIENEIILSIPVNLADGCYDDLEYRELFTNVRRLCTEHGVLTGLTVELKGLFANGSIVDGALERAQIYTAKFPNAYCHLPFVGMSSGCCEPRIRDASFEYLRECVKVASTVGVDRYVVHLNHNFDWDKPQGWMRRSVDWWGKFLQTVDMGSHFFVENTTERTCEQLNELVKRIDSDRVKACLDIGHSHCVGSKVDRWLQGLSGCIGYLHISDNMGPKAGRPFFEADRHLCIGSGTIDWDSVFCNVFFPKKTPMCLEVGVADIMASVRRILEVMENRGRT